MEKGRSNRLRWAVILFVLLSLLLTVFPLWAAYQVVRPIGDTGGQIDQTYLWGEPHPTLPPHHGLDFPYPTDTDVLAVADGTVISLDESNHNGTGSGFGNYVLVRHNQRHWNRGTSTWGYVYSIYAHLAFHSVIPRVGDPVTAGEHIADVDATGEVTGAHLHLQICVVDTDTWGMSDANDTSRNPELWLRPHNDTTGTVIGKLADVNGNPIGNFHQIRGLGKPYGEYEWSTTYSYDWAHPDDILVENWGTTDVSPGMYYPGPDGLQACDSSGQNCVPYGDYSRYTVAAGEVTYINLYLFFLPEVDSSRTYISYTAVRNNHAADTLQGNATYFDADAVGKGQLSTFIPSRGMSIFYPWMGTWYGSGIVVNSEWSVVAVVPQNFQSMYAYTGVPISSSLGLGRAKTLYMPNFLDGYNTSWYSKVVVQNTGREPTDITAVYYDTGGNLICQDRKYDVKPWQERTFYPFECGSNPPAFGSVHLSAEQPLAAVTVQYQEDTLYGRSAYNAFSSGGSTLYAPSLFRGYLGWNSRIWVHNIGTASSRVSVSYHKRDGSLICVDTLPLPGLATRVLFQGSTDPEHTCLWNYNPTNLADRMFSARLSTSTEKGQIVAIVNHENLTGGDYRSYNTFIGGRKTLVFPWVMREDGAAQWRTDIVVQNTAPNLNHISLCWYDQSGVQQGCRSSFLPAYGQWNVPLDTFSPFRGSAVVIGTQPVAAVANMMRTDLPKDAGASYGGMEER